MEFNEIWNKYVEEDITKISDEIIETFKERFPEEIYEEYDIGELLTEFTGHHETANKYDKIEEFGKIVKDQHPRVYDEDGDYINEALIKYYCFHRDREKLKEQLSDFLSRNYSYDLLLQSIEQMQYNGYDDLVNLVVEKEYEKVKNDKKLIPGAEFRLAVFKFYYELESNYYKNKDKDIKNWEGFLEKIKEYDFEVTSKELNLNYLFIEPDKVETINHVGELFSIYSNKEQVIGKLEKLFMQKMLSNNCSFGVSSFLWQKICEYFEGQNPKRWEEYFVFHKNSFNEYLASKSGFLSDNRINVFLFLWGSEYIIEFLKGYEYYKTDGDYMKQLEIIIALKEEFKQKRKNYLWEYNFIHKWKPSKEANIKEWKLEDEVFEKSYELEIKEKELEDLKIEQLFGREIFDPEPSPPKTKFVPIRTEKKIGRNEKVSVRYKDGSIKEEVKYKKVINDLESGECELI